jgi:hypothetical protein
MINLLIWSNKDYDEPGYSIGIYKYGIYDEFYNKHESDIINNRSDYNIGDRIKKA